MQLFSLFNGMSMTVIDNERKKERVGEKGVEEG